MTASMVNTSRTSRSDDHDHEHTAAAVRGGLVAGLVNAAAPFAMWWLDAATAHALIISLIAAVYVGFAVADGRPRVIAAEATITVCFVLAAATAVSATPWLIVGLYTAHGVKDLWQHRYRFVSGTRWWPPFCLTIDFLVAAIVTAEIIAGLHFR